ncbi:hypothetical protein [Syntrophaceticus schinkii]|jgi:hypothetical protein|uniref:Uncharacterized protein n=1 Tax=Syntrophaceticus schinkii TaxID=499207 RepID=A0A0B7MJ12_9FIRM|nr:hypothetical protein [Syntrophaceticus schinkii]CEO88188.1 hypothetical protein SSCH_1540008 [Syntrophaceticus schinkii]
MSQEVDLKTKMDEEIQKRVEMYNDPYYEFAPPINKQDYIAATICGIICIAGLIWGIFW